MPRPFSSDLTVATTSNLDNESALSYFAGKGGIPVVKECINYVRCDEPAPS